MSDFGHRHVALGDVHVDSWGIGPFKIELAAAGKSFLFEDSDQFGPVPLRKNGEIREPGFFAESSGFWYAWKKWRDQGRRITEDGFCIWSHDEEGET